MNVFLVTMGVNATIPQPPYDLENMIRYLFMFRHGLYNLSSAMDTTIGDGIADNIAVIQNDVFLCNLSNIDKFPHIRVKLYEYVQQLKDDPLKFIGDSLNLEIFDCTLDPIMVWPDGEWLYQSEYENGSLGYNKSDDYVVYTANNPIYYLNTMDLYSDMHKF